MARTMDTYMSDSSLTINLNGKIVLYVKIIRCFDAVTQSKMTASNAPSKRKPSNQNAKIIDGSNKRKQHCALQAESNEANHGSHNGWIHHFMHGFS